LYIKYLCSFASFGFYSIKILLIFLLFPAISFSQNYISNGSFEEICKCPNSVDKSYYAFGFPGNHSVDLFNSCNNYPLNGYCIACKVDIPFNSFGFQYTRTGNSYFGYHVTSYDTIYKFGGESFYTKLNKNLKINKLYKFSFYASLADSSEYNTDAVECILSPDTMAYWGAPWPPPPVNLKWHISHSFSKINTNFFPDTLNWTKYEYSFIAKANDIYLVFIKHHFLSSNNFFNTNVNASNVYGSAYVYIDDIAIWDPDSIPPVAEAGSNKQICLGDSVLIGGHNYSDYFYSWWHDSLCYVHGPTEIQRDEHRGQIWVKPQKTTTYYVMATDYKFDKTLDSVTVTVLDCARANAGNDTTICLFDTLSLGYENFPYFEYQWSPDYNIGYPFSGITSAWPHTTTSYILSVSDTLGNIATDTINVKVHACNLPPEIVIPNIITPNGDGINDVFRFKNEEFWHLNIQVFNRWGQLIFSGTDPERWDGTYDGKKVSDGVYFYHIAAKTDGFGMVYEYHGTVRVLRGNK
jgi:gliding motility-associated-like protein